MIQSVHQKKRQQPVVAHKKRPKATRLRPQNVNRSIQTRLAHERWERQANEAADRITQGQEEVAQILTPAPAAGKKVPASRGEPQAA